MLSIYTIEYNKKTALFAITVHILNSDGVVKQDVGKKRTARGKEHLTFVKDGKGRSTCLSKRRKTLFNKAYTMQKKTGVDVLLIVDTNRDRRFFGTGNLRSQFLEGNLKSMDSKEVDENYLGSQNEDDVAVLPLEKTPSPKGTENIQPAATHAGRIVRSATRRSLNSDLGNCDARVLEVPSNKPVPVALPNEMQQVEK